jgi:hypothetical protein
VHHLSKGLNSEVGGPPRPLVRLVTSQGTDASMRNVDEAHRMPGMLHRAFSVLLGSIRVIHGWKLGAFRVCSLSRSNGG